ncbi:MAG TPA: hypothetical protein VLH94_00775 [Spirochaetia bacterium]|nr:hypothetical protein [Spirochaetia bacterium]
MATWAVTTSGDRFEFDPADGAYNSCAKIDDTHFINFWSGISSDGFTQVFTINTSTWAITTAAERLEFDTQQATDNSCSQIDTNHFINFWGDVDGDGKVQVFTINTSTWVVTTANSTLEFDTSTGILNSCCKIDTNHFINFWRGLDQDGKAQVFTVNTTTWAVTTANTLLEFEGVDDAYNSCVQMDANHFVNFWQDSAGDGRCQVFTVNTTTWAITTTTVLEFDTQNGAFPSCCKLDDTHLINFWLGGATTTDGRCQVFTVNTTTWAITTSGAVKVFDTDVGSYNSCVKIDNNHVLNYWQGLDGDGFTQTFEINTTTWAVTTVSSQLEFETTDCLYNSCFQIDSSHYVNCWLGASADGFTQVFSVELPALGPANLKTYNTNPKSNIKTINTNPIANVKTLDTNV